MRVGTLIGPERPWRHGARAATALALVAGVSTTVGPAGAAEDALPLVDGPTVLFAGHADAVAIHLVDGAFEVRVKDDTIEPAAEYHDPEEVLLQVLPSAGVVVPEDLDPAVYAVTGPAGSTVWLLDQVQQPGLLWPGFDTAGVPTGSVVDDEVDIRLETVTGPGTVKLFGLDSSGVPEAVWDSGDGLPDTYTLPPSIHAHMGWLFTAPGSYTLTLEVTAELPDGGEATSEEVDYHIFVGATEDLPTPWSEARGARALYQGVLDRRPDTGGQAYWSDRLADGASVEALASVLAGTAEDRATTVRRAYERTFGRQPSAADSAYWADQLRRTTPDVLRARLLAAPELLAAAGGLEQWVERALWTALEREPDPATVDYWTGRVEGWGDGWAAREKVARSILRSVEARAIDIRYATADVCHRDLWGQPVPAELLASHLATNLDIGRLRAAIGSGDCAPPTGSEDHGEARTRTVWGP